MKKKLIFIILMVLIVLFAGLVFYYKFFIYSENEDNEISTVIRVEDEKKIIEESKITDKEKYESNVINDIVPSYEYNIVLEDSGIYGHIYIGKEK